MVRFISSRLKHRLGSVQTAESADKCAVRRNIASGYAVIYDLRIDIIISDHSADKVSTCHAAHKTDRLVRLDRAVVISCDSSHVIRFEEFCLSRKPADCAAVRDLTCTVFDKRIVRLRIMRQIPVVSCDSSGIAFRRSDKSFVDPVLHRSLRISSDDSSHIALSDHVYLIFLISTFYYSAVVLFCL